MDNKTIDDLVEEWSGGDDPRPLYEFLGMTLEEYALWVQTCEVPPRLKKELEK